MWADPVAGTGTWRNGRDRGENRPARNADRRLVPGVFPLRDREEVLRVLRTDLLPALAACGAVTVPWHADYRLRLAESAAGGMAMAGGRARHQEDEPDEPKGDTDRPPDRSVNSRPTRSVYTTRSRLPVVRSRAPVSNAGHHSTGARRLDAVTDVLRSCQLAGGRAKIRFIGGKKAADLPAVTGQVEDVATDASTAVPVGRVQSEAPDCLHTPDSTRIPPTTCQAAAHQPLDHGTCGTAAT